MGRRLTRWARTSAVLAGTIAAVLTALPSAQAATATPTGAAAGAGTGTGTTTDTGTAAATTQPSATSATSAVTDLGTDTNTPDAPTPLPPRLPRDFRGRGTWIVRDLGITVPFTWEGRDGDSQMTAGGPQYPIWFTNVIYHGSLYTLTYKWPNLRQHNCDKFAGFGLDQLNGLFRGARFVGPEVLQGTPDRTVNHWRVGIVLPVRPPGKYLRFPVALGDVYVAQNDRTAFWQVLQFGVQNLFDPALDEWLVMNTFEHKAGTVTLPRRCSLLP